MYEKENVCNHEEIQLIYYNILSFFFGKFIKIMSQVMLDYDLLVHAPAHFLQLLAQWLLAVSCVKI